jgi:hypothetical protein
MKTYVNVSYLKKVIPVSQKTLGKNLFFSHLVSTDEKSRIRIRKSLVRFRGSGSGSLSNCNGSTTLVPYLPNTGTATVPWYIICPLFYRNGEGDGSYCGRGEYRASTSSTTTQVPYFSTKALFSTLLLQYFYSVAISRYSQQLILQNVVRYSTGYCYFFNLIVYVGFVPKLGTKSLFC